MTDLLMYGPGIPTYLALWLPLAPLLVLVLARLGVPWRVLAVVAASTLPTFLLHRPPAWLPFPGRWLILIAVYATVAVWLAATVRPDVDDVRAPSPPIARRWLVIVGLAALAVAVRAPLAWLDPGISDIPRASETAARQVLDGHNPYLTENPHTVVGTYQYPAASIWAQLPFVVLLPATAGGEDWIPARALSWAVDAAVVVMLAVAGGAAGRGRSGVAAAAAYAVHPTVVRVSGLMAANDLLLAAAAVGSAVALSRSRPWLAGALAGVAVSVKPSAAVLVPLLLLAAGPAAAAWAAGTAVLLQLPLLLWPRPGLHGMAVLAEPAARLDAYPVLRVSTWWPLYAPTSGHPTAVRAAAVLGVALAAAVAVWAAWTLTRRAVPGRPPDLQHVAAAYGVTLLATAVLASQIRVQFEGWYLAPFLLAVGLARPTEAAPAPGLVHDDANC